MSNNQKHFKDRLSPEDFTKYEQEGITNEELANWYRITFDRGQKILILELAKLRGIYVPAETKEAA